jgi:hypothetical protein
MDREQQNNHTGRQRQRDKQIRRQIQNSLQATYSDYIDASIIAYNTEYTHMPTGLNKGYKDTKYMTILLAIQKPQYPYNISSINA